MMRPLFVPITATLMALCVYSASVAHAYDLGCQYVWKEPSSNNDLVGCLEKIPTDNGGVLIPPVIPALFLILLLLMFPVIFFCRCCGGCGSNKIRPGADCCCDGEEWDELSLSEQTSVYPKGHVCCIKVVCLLVVIMCVVPIILMPIGGKYGVTFWNEFYDSANNDVINWVQDLKDDFLADLQVDGNGTLPPPITMDSFESLQTFIDGAKDELENINDIFNTHVEVVNNCIMYISMVPLVLTAFMLLFILFNIRRVIPAIFMWIYFIVAIIFAAISIVAMALGVVFVLLGGEVELQNWKAPGVFQWYAVPMCEEEAMFHKIKTEFATADFEQSLVICHEFMDFCDDLPYSYPAVDGVSSTKPFKCSLTAANVNETCPTVIAAAELINSTFIKPELDAVCPNCTVGDCPDRCPAGDMKDKSIEIADAFAVGLRILNVVDRAFLYADCDILITQALKTMQKTDTGAWAAFLAAAGTGFGALFLMFGIVLLCKGQKLFFPKPKLEHAEDDLDGMEMQQRKNPRGRGKRVAPEDDYMQDAYTSAKPLD